jgi:hypothetical protein
MRRVQTRSEGAAADLLCCLLDDTGPPAVGLSCHRCLRREPLAPYASGVAVTPSDSAPHSRGSLWFLITAVAAWLGVVTVYLFAAIVPPDPQTVETLYGYDGISTPLRVFQTAFYFTVLSVTVVAIVSTMLWRDSTRNTFWFAVLRLDALVMIVVTGLVYAVVLAPTSTATGWNLANTILMHYIVPSLSVLAWLFAGPRGLLRFAHVLPMLIIPLLWLACTLLLGQLIDAYPYDFLDVATYGLGPVLATSAAIVVAATVLGFMLVGIDRLISSRVGRRSPA